MSKIYSKAPLSFIGQKRNFIIAFRNVIAEHIPHEGEGWTIIDVFGGSGLLAHNAKHLCPKATVIYNDFDGYAERLEHVADTERLRQLLLTQLSHIKHATKLTDNEKQGVVATLQGFDGFIDVQSISNWLLFSGKQVANFDELVAENFYQKIRRTPYVHAESYLDGLVITNESYTTLMPRYSDQPNTLFLLDPPYLCTAQGAYQQDKYFALVDFLYLMSLTRPPYILFSSTKSELLDYMDYLKRQNGEDWQRLGGFEKISIATTLNKNAGYEDNMIYRFI